MRGATILASLLMQGFSNVQESKGDLTRDHYLNSPPIEPSLKEFSHTRKIPRWSGRDSNPRLRAQRQARRPLSHQTTLNATCRMSDDAEFIEVTYVRKTSNPLSTDRRQRPFLTKWIPHFLAS